MFRFWMHAESILLFILHVCNLRVPYGLDSEMLSLYNMVFFWAFDKSSSVLCTLLLILLIVLTS